METESVLQIGGQFQSVFLGFQGVLRNRRTSPPIQKVKIVPYGMAMLCISGDAGTAQGSNPDRMQTPGWAQQTEWRLDRGISTPHNGTGNDIPTALTETAMSSNLPARFKEWDPGVVSSVREKYMKQAQHIGYVRQHYRPPHQKQLSRPPQQRQLSRPAILLFSFQSSKKTQLKFLLCKENFLRHMKENKHKTLIYFRKTF